MDNEQEIPNEEEFNHWMALPVSRWFFRVYLPKRSEEIRRRWAAGVYTAESQAGTIQMNAAAMGEHQAISDLEAFDYAGIQGEFDAGNSERGPNGPEQAE
jgi:hypothetical protein